jgi:hypothetical protein
MVWRIAMRELGQVRSRLFNSAADRRGGSSRYGSDVRGVASIEMALIFPMMLIVFVGLIDASNLMTANRRVTLTASTLGDLVTQAPGKISRSRTSTGSSVPPNRSWTRFRRTARHHGVLYLQEVGRRRGWIGATRAATRPAALPRQPTITEMLKLMAEDNDVVVSRVCYSGSRCSASSSGSRPPPSRIRSC